MCLYVCVSVCMSVYLSACMCVRLCVRVWVCVRDLFVCGTRAVVVAVTAAAVRWSAGKGKKGVIRRGARNGWEVTRVRGEGVMVTETVMQSKATESDTGEADD